MSKGPIVEDLPETPQTVLRVPFIPAGDPATPTSGPLDEKTEAWFAGSVDTAIEVWFAKHFHGLGALLDERLYNVIHAAKEDLKAELRKL